MARRAVRFHASVAWEGPEYEVEVVSTDDGDVKLAFVDGAAFGASAASRWSMLQAGVVSPLSDTLESFARGHDFFLNLVRPETRLDALHFAGTTAFSGQPALMVTGTDRVGGVVRLYYAATDTLPLGFEVEDHLRGGGTVATELGGWTSRDGVRLPGAVRFTQGAEVFDYTIEESEVHAAAPDSLFLPGASG